MSDLGIQNPFAPPRAPVDDPVDSLQEMVPATRGARFAAWLIDGLGSSVMMIGILAAVALPAYQNYVRRAKGLAVTPAGGGSYGAGIGVLLMFLGLAMIAFLICSAVFLYRDGQTVGKRVMGIRVVRSDGSRVAFPRFVFLRWLPLFVLGLVPYIGYALTLLNALLIFRETRKCLHDNIADTRVVTAASSRYATLAGSSGAHLRTISF